MSKTKKLTRARRREAVAAATSQELERRVESAKTLLADMRDKLERKAVNDVLAKDRLGRLEMFFNTLATFVQQAGRAGRGDLPQSVLRTLVRMALECDRHSHFCQVGDNGAGFHRIAPLNISVRYQSFDPSAPVSQVELQKLAFWISDQRALHNGEKGMVFKASFKGDQSAYFVNDQVMSDAPVSLWLPSVVNDLLTMLQTSARERHNATL